MPVKDPLTAGITALALLATPVGLTARWSDHGPAISTAPAVSTANAASNQPTPKKPPANGAPVVTTSSSATVTKTRGFHPSLLVDKMSEYCQAMADIYDDTIDLAVYHSSIGNHDRATELAQRAGAIETDAQSRGCVFVTA